MTMQLLNKNSSIIPWDFDPNDVKAWETARFNVQHGGDMLRFGGSELSSVLGLNKYDSTFYLFHAKLGRLSPKTPNILMVHGNAVEATIIDYVRSYNLNNPSEEETACNFLKKSFIRNIYKAEFFIVSEDYPCMSISLDGVLPTGEPSLHDPNLLMPFDAHVEIKNVGYHSFESWKGVIPSYYMSQLQGAMAVTGVPYSYFIALVENRKLWVQKVDADPEWFELLNDGTIDLSLRITKAKEILKTLDEYTLDDWHRDELLRQLYELEPIADHLDSTTGAIKELYTTGEGADLIDVFDESLENILGRYLDINKELNELNEEKATLKNQSLQKLKGQSPVKCGSYKVKSGKSFLVSKLKGS